MKRTKRLKLTTHGWRVGSTAEFLELSLAEAALVETRLILSRALRDRRRSRRLTQEQVARVLKSSQSRVAKMECGDQSVSVDLLMKALFCLGASPRNIAKV